MKPLYFHGQYKVKRQNLKSTQYLTCSDQKTKKETKTNTHKKNKINNNNTKKQQLNFSLYHCTMCSKSHQPNVDILHRLKILAKYLKERVKGGP